MRLYPKKLRNIHDLEREKKLLLKQTRRMDKDDLFSLDGLTTGKKKGKVKEEKSSASFVDMLPISNPVISTLLSLLEKRLLKKSDKEAYLEYASPVLGKKHKSILAKIAKEFVLGYLKWKAIELSYKGAKVIVKKLKQKKAERRSAAISGEL